MNSQNRSEAWYSKSMGRQQARALREKRADEKDEIREKLFRMYRETTEREERRRALKDKA
jgi:hypothetical protein